MDTYKLAQYEKIWERLKDYIKSKTSHGKNELLKVMEGMELTVEPSREELIEETGISEV